MAGKRTSPPTEAQKKVRQLFVMHGYCATARNGLAVSRIDAVPPAIQKELRELEVKLTRCLDLITKEWEGMRCRHIN